MDSSPDRSHVGHSGGEGVRVVAVEEEGLSASLRCGRADGHAALDIGWLRASRIASVILIPRQIVDVIPRHGPDYAVCGRVIWVGEPESAGKGALVPASCRTTIMPRINRSWDP